MAANIGAMKLWLCAVLLIFSLDVAMPLSPGAYQPFEPGQSVEVARSLSVEVADAAPLPSPHPRSAVITQQASRISMAHAARRESLSRSFVVPLVRSPQVEAEAPSTTEDPA